MMRPKTAILFGLGALLLWTATANAGPVQLRTGASSAADGYLEARPDEYGALAANFTSGAIGTNGDTFNPAGAATAQVVSFTNGFFLFGPQGQRELLSDFPDWQATTNGAGGPAFSADASLSRSILTPNAAIDTNGDGVNDLANSEFRVFGGATDLRFQLQQRVVNVSSGVSYLQQDYTVTNQSTAGAIAFTMVRAADLDLVFDNNFETESVGTTANGAGLGPYVFEQEPNQPGQSMTLSIPTGGSYYGGKHGLIPGLGAPAYDFGTDTEVWDANGVPTSWVNNIAGIGYSTNGISGASPPGSTAPRDAFMGVDLSLSLASGQSTSFQVFHVYGQTSPIPEPAAATFVAIGIAVLAMYRRNLRAT